MKKWKPVTWWKWAGAIIATFFLYSYGVVYGTTKLEFLMSQYIQNANYATQYMNTVYVIGPFVSLLLSLSPLLAVWFIYKKYTWGRFFVAFTAGVLVFVLNALYWYWFFITGIQGLIQRFNF